MENKSFLIVSQGGKPARRIRIHFLTVFLPAVFIALGAAAYFIPADMFRLQTAELRQKKILHTQNNQIRERFLSTLKVLNRAREQITGVEVKKENLAALTGTAAAMERTDGRTTPHGGSAPDYSDLNPAEFYARLCGPDSVVSAFAARAAKGGNPFERIPVCKPVGNGAVISRGFGMNLDPFTGLRKQHNGVDFVAPAGSQVIAAAAGYVSSIENSALWGKKVVISHGNGLSTVYAHLGSVSIGRGRSVKRGAVIGSIGVSGLSSGPHVHYEVWRNNIAIDPEKVFFPARGQP